MHKFTRDIEEDLVHHTIPYIYLGVDIWIRSVPKQTFVGARANWVSTNYKKTSALRLPSESMNVDQASDLIHAFVHDALSEHKISETEHISGCSLDAISEKSLLISYLHGGICAYRTCLAVLFRKPWEQVWRPANRKPEKHENSKRTQTRCGTNPCKLQWSWRKLRSVT